MTPADSISTSVERHGDITVLATEGVVDLATAPKLEEVIDGLVADGLTTLVIDLSGVTFMASVGLKILVATQERLGPTAQFGVVAHGPATSRPIQLTRLDEVFSLFTTLQDALQSMRDSKLKG